MSAERSITEVLQQEADTFNQVHDVVKAKVGDVEYTDFNWFLQYPFYLVGTGDTPEQVRLFYVEHKERQEYPGEIFISESLGEPRRVPYGNWAELAMLVKRIVDTEEVDRVIESLSGQRS